MLRQALTRSIRVAELTQRQQVLLASTLRQRSGQNCHASHVWPYKHYLIALQVHSGEQLAQKLRACLAQARTFSSSSLGTAEVAAEPTPSTSYLIPGDDEVTTIPCYQLTSLRGLYISADNKHVC